MGLHTIDIRCGRVARGGRRQSRERIGGRPALFAKSAGPAVGFLNVSGRTNRCQTWLAYGGADEISGNEWLGDLKHNPAPLVREMSSDFLKEKQRRREGFVAIDDRK